MKLIPTIIPMAVAVLIGLGFIACGSPAASPPAVAPEPEPEQTIEDVPEIPVIVEFADFQCGFCARFALKTLPLLQRDIVNEGIARFEYRHFPFLSPESIMAAEASECARDQGQFMEYHNGVYELLARREGMGPENLRGVAEGLGLDLSEFDACTQNRVHRETVEADKEYGRTLGVRGTPTLFIDGEALDWYSYRSLLKGVREHANGGVKGEDGL